MDKIKRLIVVKNKAIVRKLQYILKDITKPIEEWRAISTDGYIFSVYVRDLNAKKIAWTPRKRKHLEILTEALSWADYVYIAMDSNGPGELLSLQVQDLMLTCNNANIYRIYLKELTKKGVQRALSNPGKVDEELALSEKLRIEINEILEYTLSSVTFSIFGKDVVVDHIYPYILNKIIEQERKRRAYKHKPSFYIEILTIEGIRARSDVVVTYEQAEKLLTKFQNKELILDYAGQGKYTVQPPGPFTFLSFIKFACAKYNKKTQEITRILQSLYQKGRISFYDTSSTYISNDTVKKAWTYIKKFRNRNSIYAPKYSTKDIDKALQPVTLKFTPKKAVKYLKGIELQIYTDIWCGVISTQCANATILKQSVDYYIDDEAILLSITGDNVIYGGWMNVAPNLLLESKRSLSAKNCRIAHAMILPSKPNPPPCYTTTSLIQLLENEDFADPRVYIEAIEKLEKYKLISISKNSDIKPHARGEAIIKWIKANVPFILSYDFISKVESDLYLVKRNGSYLDALSETNTIYTKLINQLKDAKILYSSISCPQCSNKTQLTMDTGENDPYVWCDVCDWWEPVMFNSEGNEILNVTINK